MTVAHVSVQAPPLALENPVAQLTLIILDDAARVVAKALDIILPLHVVLHLDAGLEKTRFLKKPAQWFFFEFLGFF